MRVSVMPTLVRRSMKPHKRQREVVTLLASRIDSVAPVILTDDKWRNFGTENLQHEVGPGGCYLAD